MNKKLLVRPGYRYSCAYISKGKWMERFFKTMEQMNHFLESRGAIALKFYFPGNKKSPA